MVIYLKDGTQEFIRSPDKFKEIITDRMGDECGQYIQCLISEIEELKEDINCNNDWESQYDALYDDNMELGRENDSLKNIIEKAIKTLQEGL